MPSHHAKSEWIKDKMQNQRSNIMSIDDIQQVYKSKHLMLCSSSNSSLYIGSSWGNTAN